MGEIFHSQIPILKEAFLSVFINKYSI